MSSGQICEQKIQVLELFSGIGGVHYALEESEIPHEVVAAVDINDQANAIYRHSFPGTKLLQRCIESLTLKELDRLSPDLIHMSPPCQPFTRVGKQQDSADERTKSFFSILDLLPKLAKRPSYILVENVKGFETSNTRSSLTDTLHSCGYVVQEMLLSPVQFGIPNSRLRYYLLAKLSPLHFQFPTSSELLTELPECAKAFLYHGTTSSSFRHTKRSSVEDTLVKGKYQRREGCFSYEPHGCGAGDSEASDTCGSGLMTSCQAVVMPYSTDCKHCDSRQTESTPSAHATQSDSAQLGQVDIPLHEKYVHRCGTLADYLEQESEEYFTPYLLPEKFYKRVWVMDLVTANVRHSCCFTKRYGHHVEGAGSVIQMNTNTTTDIDKYKTGDRNDVEFLDAVRSLKLRYFTPREIANLMGFPPNFTFPDGVAPIQCYRVLGNSLNVHVVSVLIRLLTADGGTC